MLSKAEVLTIQQWEKSVIPLCPCEVHLTGRIEDAGPKVLQVTPAAMSFDVSLTGQWSGLGFYIPLNS